MDVGIARIEGQRAFKRRRGFDGKRTALFGGEGLFFATLRGPGAVMLQSLPFSRLASRIFAAAPRSMGGGGGGREEGSVLGGLGSIIGGRNDD